MPIYLDGNTEHDVFYQPAGSSSYQEVEVYFDENATGDEVLIYTPKTVITSFESGSFDGATTGGSSSYFQPEIINDSTVAFDGSYYLRFYDGSGGAGGGSGWVWADASNLLDNQPYAGQTFRSGVYIDTANEIAEVGYGLQELTNEASPQGYKLLLKSGFMAIRYTRSDGTSYTMASTNVDQSLITKEDLYFEGVWPDPPSGNHTFRILRADGSEFASINGDGYSDDSDYHGGGFGFRGGDDSTGAYEVRFDDAYVVD